MNKNVTGKLLELLTHKSIFEKMFGPEDSIRNEEHFFLQKNSQVIGVSAAIMIIINSMWLIINALTNNSRGLDYLPARYGLIAHIIICVFTELIISFFPKLKKTKINSILLLRITHLLYYLGTLYSVFFTIVAKDIIYQQANVHVDAGAPLICLYYICIALSPVFYNFDMLIICIGGFLSVLLPKFIVGGDYYQMLPNFLIICCSLILYIYYRSSLHLNFTLRKTIIQANEDESRKHLAVINALGDEFTEIIYVNLDNNTCQKFREDYSIFTNKIDESKTYDFNFKESIIPAIVESDRDKVLYSLNSFAISKKFIDSNSFEINCKAIKKNNTEENYQIKVVKDENSQENIAIIGLRSIESQVRESLALAKQLEDAKNHAEAASKAKSVFLFNMSHDIRTPMNAISGYLEMAKKYKDNPEKVDDCLNKMGVASEHLLKLINDVLDMARIESGKVSLDENPINVVKLAADMKNIIMNSAADHNISLKTSINVKNQYMYIDSLRASQIVLNLTSNAIKYTKEFGTVYLSLDEIEPQKRGFITLKFVVKDTGIGMSKQFLEHIFESFSRESNTTKSGVQGTGLGMAITKNLTDMMGGTIDIQSEINVGTTVTTIFNFRIASPVDEEKKLGNADKQKLRGMNVLLAEDNALNREIATDILQDLGIYVTPADDGSVAVDIMKNAKPGDFDLILMDVQMLYMDGYQATDAIRHLDNKEIADIPIIAMTANAFAEDRQNALKAGMNAHLAKPIDIEDLISTLYRFSPNN